MESNKISKNKQPVPWWVWVVVIVISMMVGAALKDCSVSESRQYNATSSGSPKVVDPISLLGTGQTATELFYLQDGLVRFAMTHNGYDNFSIVLMQDNGDYIELLVNEIGSFNGSKAEKIVRPGYYLLDISADGYWSVKITQ